MMAVPLIALSIFPNATVVVGTLVRTSGAFSMWNVFMVSARQWASTPQTLGRIGVAYRSVVVTAALAGTLAERVPHRALLDPGHTRRLGDHAMSSDTCRVLELQRAQLAPLEPLIRPNLGDGTHSIIPSPELQ